MQETMIDPAGLALDALANQTRREILTMLREQPLPVGEIAARLPVSRPAVSKHLRQLTEANLVEYEPQGASNIFRLKPDGFREARRYLDDFWDQALDSFQQFVRATQENEDS